MLMRLFYDNCFFETYQCVFIFYGIIDASLHSSSQCVRDWSGILLKRSGKRYSGKPDGGAGTPRDNS